MLGTRVFTVEKGSQLDYLLLQSTQLRFLLWFFSVVLVLAMVVTLIINKQRVSFVHHTHEAVNNINRQLLINDVALSSFGSLLTSVGPQNSQKTRDFTEYMRDAYPHIYMFEALISIDPANKAQHESLMQEFGYKDYKLTRYVGNKEPQGKPFNMIDGVPMHFPIIFIDPYIDSVKGLMGFDMMSVQTTREPLLASLASGEPTASAPYKLREGGRGYVLIKALDTLADKGPVYSEGGLAVLLMIKTDAMLVSVADIVPAASVRLLYGKQRKLAAEEISPPITALPMIKIDTFMEERDLDDLGQPFTLSIRQSAGLYAQDLQVLVLIFTVMCIAYVIYHRSLIAKYRLQLQRDVALVELSQQHANLEVMVTKRTKELQRKSDENTSLAQQLIRVQEDQFHHIARELHDEFGQTLTAIKINAHILENAQTMQGAGTYAQDITAQADALYETMRNMIQRLRPEALDMFGLKVAVEQCILAFHLHEQGVELNLNISDSVDDVAEMYSIASYRIVQELVNNAVKYAQLTKLKVWLDAADGYMNITVEDNGIGFDPLEHKEGFGLSGVDERARSLGGIVDISTVVDEGVKVCVRIPLQDC
jgi:signal transduction histidine kinase